MQPRGGAFITNQQRREGRYQRRKAARERARLAHAPTFDNVFSFAHLYASYKKCCLGVGWKCSTQTYRANAMLNVYRAYQQLHAGTYKSKGFVEFDIFERGKPRHIRAVHISERVIQRCLCDYALTPMLGKSFIYDNGASMHDKGISFSLQRLTTHLRRHWRRYGNAGYILTFDLHHYFDSIPHAPLLRMLKKAIPDARIYAISKDFIDAFGDTGLGLGSQISQIGALAFLSGLDHTIKERAHIRGYARYMDDGYLICRDKAHLQKCRAAIIRYCAGLGLTLNENKTQIIALKRGFTFLKIRFRLTASGAIIKRPHKKNITAMRRKLRVFRRWTDDKENRFTLADAQTSLTSWAGHIAQTKSWRTRANMEKLFSTLFQRGQHAY